MFKRFASIAHSKEYAYTYDSTAWTSNAPMEGHFRQYSTYGDGLVAHSPDWSVQVEYLADYLASLAQAMLTDAELANELYYTIWQRPSVKQIEFAASIVYKAPKDDTGWNRKRRYFSVKELKVSAAPSKEHDKRYEEVRDIHNGTPSSIFCILVPEYSDGLQKYIYASAIRDWALEQDGMYMELPAEFLKWFDDRDKSLRLRDAYEACRDICESYRLRASVESRLENYKRHVTPKPAEPEAAASEQEQANGQAEENPKAEAQAESADAADKVA